MKAPWRRGPTKLERVLGAARLDEAMGRAERAVPSGSLIFTSWSPKVEVAHVKSARYPGAVCEAMREREDWLGTGSDKERDHAASLRICGRCIRGATGTADEVRAS